MEDLSFSCLIFRLNMSKNFEHFRILVCGGDGSVGWVLTEVDKQELTNKVFYTQNFSLTLLFNRHTSLRWNTLPSEIVLRTHSSNF